MDPKKRSTKTEAHGQNPKIVGLPRNAFGTRLSQRVQCEKCAKVDYIPVRVNAAKPQFCRSCAEQFLSAYDQGRQIAEKRVYRVCGQCHSDFLVNELIARKKDHILCDDCHRGFEVWRGRAKAGRNHNQTQSLLLKKGPRTTFRKNVDDKL
jgi:hypothetical protein